ncbi:aldo/keto reductase [Brevundimonas sp.]|uniref:aldo/keto reductase n=1 Tax=Brevundimonas sp. TaxID=1871086 RepID=UPI001D84329B|nr:aldo/keto reductase [Brevundimonas sp.]MBL0946798.1 aldo/keto reductase [Brevundimonas sp.]
MARTDTLTVDGHDIPLIGLGTWQLEPDDARRMVGHALTNGYRHIDTAWIYRNEHGVGQGIRDAGVPRDSFWLTTKIWVDHFSHDALLKQAEESANSLGTAPDLLLLHWPKATPPLEETIAALNEAKARGLTRSIGLSNYPSAEWRKAQQLSEARLVTNQVEYHPYLSQKTLIDTARDLRASITAWSPLAQGKIAEDATLRTIAEAHGRSVGQVTLRWIVQQGVIAIPRTSKESRAAENLDIFDFSLTDEEMARIHGLAHPGGRLGDWIDPAFEWDQDTSRQ